MKKIVAVAVGAVLLSGCSLDDDDTECTTITTVGVSVPAPRPAPMAPRVTPPKPAPRVNPPKGGTVPLQPNAPRTQTTCWERDEK